MATRIFTNATGGWDITIAGNWSGTPADGDDLIIDYGLAGQTITGDLSARAFASVYIKRTCQANIGALGTPALFGCTLLEVDGGGPEIHLGTGASNPWTNVLISFFGNGFGNCSLTPTAGATLITIACGIVNYVGGTTATVVMAANGGQGPTLKVNGGVITALEQNAGSGYQVASSTITTHRMHAGLFRTDTGTYTNLYLDGGQVIWNNTATLTLLQGIGGTFDASQVARARTITTGNGYMGFAYMKNAQVTVTNNNLSKYGGRELPYVGTPQVA